jgi:uronate dehydrogenase
MQSRHGGVLPWRESETMDLLDGGQIVMAAPARVLLTGAAGTIGSRVREFLRPRCLLRVTDVVDLGAPRDGEEIVVGDLADPALARAAAEEVDVVVHLAGIPREAPIEAIAQANLIATWNVFAAARDAGARRVVFGSSNHVIGFCSPEEAADVATPARPDTLYGASKVFGEAAARLFWDKHGLEAVCVRIGSALPRPTLPRHLSTWVSYDDLNALIWCSLTAARVGYTVVYGMSDNARAWWSNAGTQHLGYQPNDRAEDHAAEVLARAGENPPGDPHSPALRFQGGPWAADGFSADRRHGTRL